MKGNNSRRSTNWTIVVYPDSLPSGWRDIVDEMHIEWVESPLHDKDLNGTGEPKKPHYHLLLMFGGLKSYEQVLEIIQPLNCPIPCIVQNCKSLVRYFAHLDNPEKVQYNASEIIPHGGIDINDLLKPSMSERHKLLDEIFTYIKENNINELQDLIDYARSKRFDDWFSIICDNSLFVVSQYIKSQRHRCMKINPETGEIIQ